MEKVFILKGLDCPNCSAKIEKEIGALAGVNKSSINLMKQTLTIQVEASAAASVAKQIEAIVHNHEPDVIVSENTTQTITKAYLLKGLDCPNCSTKIETEIGALAGVNESSINLMKQTLTIQVEASAAAAVAKQIEAIVHNHEPGVMVLECTVNAPGSSKAAQSDSHNDKIMVIRLIFGAFLFATGIVLSEFVPVSKPVSLAFLILAYAILGGDVVMKACKNIIKGRVFDENFLMSLSTIGAFIIGEYPEAVAVMFFYQVGEYFQRAAVTRSRKSIADLMDIRPDSATVIRKGAQLVVSPDAVTVGEWIVVRPGERIPLDGIVLDGESMLDTKALTGESVPKNVHKDDEVLSGCINQSGVLTIRVTKAFGESTASKIIDLVENASSRKAPTENFITTFARYYTPVVVIMAVILAITPPLLFHGSWVEWIHRALVFLVISCPCALVISIPLTFFGGIGAASRHGVLVKGSNYLEALNHVETIVFDKTGTLTKGVFHVTEIFPSGDFTKEQILEYAAMAECYSNHPIAKSIISAYGKEVDQEVADYQEISGYGVSVTVDGKKILAGNAKLMAAESIPYSPCGKAGTKVYVTVAGQYAGCILISDEMKADSKNAITALKKIGVQKTVMLTGDDDAIGKAVSEELGLDEYYAQLLPGQKVEKLEQLDSRKRAGRKLAFVGDGINDAPVLARADVGIAMGGLGSDAAIEAADVVLMTDEPSKLVDAIHVAKDTKRIVIQNILIAFAVKGVFLILGAFGLAGMWEAVFADVGVALIAVFNAMRIMKK